MVLNTGTFFRRGMFPASRFTLGDDHGPSHDAQWERSIRHDMLIQQVDEERRLLEARARMIVPTR